MGREQLVRYAKARLDSGVIHEPRGFFDVMELSTTEGQPVWPVSSRVSQTVTSSPEVFRNGEAFPVTLTHAAFAVGKLNQEDGVDDERDIQRIGVRMKYHDQYYMNKLLFPCPIWSNKVVALADVCSFGTSTWRFADGKHVEDNGGGSFILSARDTLQVDVQIEVAPAYGIRATVAFTGIGLLSQRSYFLTATTDFTVARGDGQVTTLIPNDLRNDGSEPILITDMTLNINEDGAEALASIGDIRRLRVNVKQVGNGTNASWFHGPRLPVVFDRVAATLLGITGGRAVIHEFPEPLIWNPGDGIVVEANGIAVDAWNPPDSFLNVGLFGYIIVK